ncbi:MAG: hypothetical protein GWN58_58490 [Anaerolineae bacterium]|nr:hypothetical protein [Anaerolineae bacterium]
MAIDGKCSLVPGGSERPRDMLLDHILDRLFRIDDSLAEIRETVAETRQEVAGLKLKARIIVWGAGFVLAALAAELARNLF